MGGKKEGTVRRCIKCGQRMLSSWAGHRLCDRCRHKNNRLSGGHTGRIVCREMRKAYLET